MVPENAELLPFWAVGLKDGYQGLSARALSMDGEEQGTYLAGVLDGKMQAARVKELLENRFPGIESTDFHVSALFYEAMEKLLLTSEIPTLGISDLAARLRGEEEE